LGREAILPLRLRRREFEGSKLEVQSAECRMGSGEALEELGVQSAECRLGSGEVLIFLVFEGNDSGGGVTNTVTVSQKILEVIHRLLTGSLLCGGQEMGRRVERGGTRISRIAKSLLVKRTVLTTSVVGIRNRPRRTLRLLGYKNLAMSIGHSYAKKATA
jgi:hypothetical protein